MADIANLMPDQRTDERYTPSAVMDMCLAMYRLLQLQHARTWAEKAMALNANEQRARILASLDTIHICLPDGSIQPLVPHHEGLQVIALADQENRADANYAKQQENLNAATALLQIRVRDALAGTRLDIYANETVHHGGFMTLVGDQETTGNPTALLGARFLSYNAVTAELVVQSGNDIYLVPLFGREANESGNTMEYVQMATILNISRDPVPDELAS